MKIQKTFGFKLITELTLLAFYFATISLFYPKAAQAINESQSVIDLGQTTTNSDVVAAIAYGGTIPFPGYVSAFLGLPAGAVYTSSGLMRFSQVDMVVPGRIPIRSRIRYEYGILRSVSFSLNIRESIRISCSGLCVPNRITGGFTKRIFIKFPGDKTAIHSFLNREKLS